MQGRLLPKYKGRYQAHPVDYWDDEYPIARRLGLDCIEFILDYDEVEMNPLMSDVGIDKILRLGQENGLVTRTVCADYFMEAPLHDEDELRANQSVSILKNLLRKIKRLEVNILVMPCVDGARLDSAETIRRFIEKIKIVLPDLESNDVNLSLETDLAPGPFVELLECIDSDRISVNYDIGNSAALGYDANEELELYGDRISNVHVKDRLLGGGPVSLGKGAANLNLVFSKLREIKYGGSLIMQAYRDDEGIQIFREQLRWLRPFLEKLDE